MIDLLTKEISDCRIALQQPNRAIDSYRAYWEGRKDLAEELLLKLQQANVMRLLPLSSEVELALNMAQCELRSMYSKVGIKDSNILKMVDETWMKVQAAISS